METCKVEFTSGSGQKIILDFTIDDKGEVEYKPSFEPKADPKTNLGLSGKLCEIFLTALASYSEQEDVNNGNCRKTKEKPS